MTAEFTPVLMIDHGIAETSQALRDALVVHGIQVVVASPGQSQPKGLVETTHELVERVLPRRCTP